MQEVPTNVVAKPSFNAAAEETINEALAICNQRHEEYTDSWHLDNLKTAFLDNLLRDYKIEVPKEFKRLMILAGMCDVKISRLSGPFKKDTPHDLINYTGAYTSFRDKFDKKQIDFNSGLNAN